MLRLEWKKYEGIFKGEDELVWEAKGQIYVYRANFAPHFGGYFLRVKWPADPKEGRKDDYTYGFAQVETFDELKNRADKFEREGFPQNDY